MPNPIIGPTYALNVRSADVQRAVNLVPVPIESGSGANTWMLKSIPGLSVFGYAPADAVDVQANFAAVHPWPALKSKMGFAQNLNSLGQGLEGTAAFLLELGACGFSGACEFDVWYKHPETQNPCINATYVSGRAVSMTTTPTATVTGWATSLNNAAVMCGIQLIGAVPSQQIALTYEPRRHPPPINVAAHGAIVSAWIDGTKWPCPINWSLWNEPLRTMYDCKKGLGLLNESIVETDDQYILRRQGLKEQAVAMLGSLYLATFSTSTTNIGKWSTASVGSLLSGDTRTSNGRSMLDGRTARAGWWDYYDANIAPVSAVTKATYATHNNFGNRATIRGDVSDFNGKDYGLWETQGAPGLLKAEDPDGGELEVPASATRMGPACEWMTRCLVDWERPEQALTCSSYWMGGQDGFVSYVSPGVYTKRHRFTAAKMLAELPTRRVPLTGVKQGPEADASLYATQGLIGAAGIDPANKTAMVVIWNEQPFDAPINLSRVNFPSVLAGASAVTKVLDEANPLGAVGAWDGVSQIVLKARSALQVTWTLGADAQARRDPLDNGIRNPRFLRRVGNYKRPKGASAYTDQVRGVSWVMPSTKYTGTLKTGAAWKTMVDTVYCTLYAHNVDAGSNAITITCDYGSGAVTLWSSTAGAITAGQVVTLDIVGNAPGGWSAGAREADLSINHTGAATTQRVECWWSGTLTKANGVKP